MSARESLHYILASVDKYGLDIGQVLFCEFYGHRLGPVSQVFSTSEIKQCRAKHDKSHNIQTPMNGPPKLFASPALIG